MPLALVVAPSDPRTGDAASRREALGWLRGQLARSAFDVVIVGGGQDARSAVEKAAPTITPGDVVLVHLSGRLRGTDELAFGLESAISLRTLTEILEAREPAMLSFIVEVGYDDPPLHVPGPDEVLALVVDAVASPARRHAVLAAVRPLGGPASRVAFTRVAMVPAPQGPAGPEVDDWLAAMYEHAASQPEVYETASRFVHAPTAIRKVAASVEVAVSTEPSTPYGVPSPVVHDDSPLAPQPESARSRPDAPASFAPPYAEPAPACAEPASHVEVAPEYLEPAYAEPAVEPAPGYPEPAPPSYGAAPSVPPPLPPSFRLPVPEPLHPDSMPPPARHPEASGVSPTPTKADWQRELMGRFDRLNTLGEAKARVRELVQIARILQAELDDPHGAIAALEQARELDPVRGGVLRALRRGYEAVGRWANAIEVLGALADIADTAVERAGLRAAQARLALDRMDDDATAMACVRGALDEDPRNAEALGMAKRWPALNMTSEPPPPVAPVEPPAPAWTLADVDRATLQSPGNPEAYAAAFSIHRRNGNTDGAFLAALALEELGAADVDQQILIDQFRTLSPSRARASLDPPAWERLRAPGYDPVLAAVFAAVEEAAIGLKIEDLRAAGRLPELDRTQRLPESSTASIVRSFQWAARFLGIGCPDLYAMDDAPGIAVMHAIHPSTALGRSVLSGPSAKDLAFLAGRHLTYYRPEYHVILYYPTRDELTTLLIAAVQLGLPEAPSMPPALRTLRARLARRIGERDHVMLARAIRELNARGGHAQIGAWMRAVELTAARTGLLLCGDLASAAAVVRSESRPLGDLTTEERRGDLVAFSASEAHVDLRARFIATALDSMVPPPPGTGGPPPSLRTLAAQ
jgi:tetratricopeptide (TPR) repeat protein